MAVWALMLEYDGTPFVGWQRQDNGVSVQQVLERAASHLTGGVPVSSVVAGRTDAGGHAEPQVGQLPPKSALPANRLREALNYHMKPHPVVVLQAALAPAGWNARFSAIGRAYRYRILNPGGPPGAAGGTGVACAPAVGRRCHAHGGAAAAGAARFHFVPRRGVPGEEPGAHAGPARCHARWGGDRRGRRGAQFFAPSGAKHGGHAEAGRGRTLVGGAIGRCSGGARPVRSRANRAAGGSVADRGAVSGRSVWVTGDLSPVMRGRGFSYPCSRVTFRPANNSPITWSRTTSRMAMNLVVPRAWRVANHSIQSAQPMAMICIASST